MHVGVQSTSDWPVRGVWRSVYVLTKKERELEREAKEERRM